MVRVQLRSEEEVAYHLVSVCSIIGEGANYTRLGRGRDSIIAATLEERLLELVPALPINSAIVVEGCGENASEVSGIVKDGGSGCWLTGGVERICSGHSLTETTPNIIQIVTNTAIILTRG